MQVKNPPPRPINPTNDTHAIVADFRRARAEGKVAGRISKPELQRIFRNAVTDGFTPAEKRTLVQQWHNTFGMPVNATKAAKLEYAMQAFNHNLPKPLPVF